MLKNISLDKVGFRFLALLFILLPFHAFLTTFFSSLFDVSTKDSLSLFAFLISSWKEILMVIIGGFICVHSFIKKKFPFRILLIDYLIFVLFVWALISAFFQSSSYIQGLTGVRFDFEFFILYWIVRSLPITKEQLRKLLKYMLISTTVVVIFGIIQIIQPCEFMTNFGYTPYVSSWVSSKPLPCGHGIGKNFNIIRMMSTFSGPNQLASYLLINILVAWYLLTEYLKVNKKETVIKYSYIMFLVLSLTALYLTYSRGALLALLAAFLCMLVLQASNSKRTFSYLIIGMVTCVLLFTSNIIFSPDRIDSTRAHFKKPIEGIQIVTENPWGLGLGMAGPASMRFPPDGSKAIVSENWYLQIAQEFGLIGAFLFFLLLSAIVRFLFQNHQFQSTKSQFFTITILSIYIGLLVNNLFMHTWSTDMITSLLFWSLLAICINFILIKKKKGVPS